MQKIKTSTIHNPELNTTYCVVSVPCKQHVKSCVQSSREPVVDPMSRQQAPWQTVTYYMVLPKAQSERQFDQVKCLKQFQNQHLQLCTARTALSDSVIRSAKIG